MPLTAWLPHAPPFCASAAVTLVPNATEKASGQGVCGGVQMSEYGQTFKTKNNTVRSPSVRGDKRRRDAAWAFKGPSPSPDQPIVSLGARHLSSSSFLLSHSPCSHPSSPTLSLEWHGTPGLRMSRARARVREMRHYAYSRRVCCSCWPATSWWRGRLIALISACIMVRSPLSLPSLRVCVCVYACTRDVYVCMGVCGYAMCVCVNACMRLCVCVYL